MSSISGRFWRFAMIALAGTIVVAVAVAAFYREVALENFKEMRAEQHVQLARSLSNTLIEDVRQLGEIAAVSSWEEMQASPEVQRFATLIEQQLEHLPVYLVNIFATDGLILYSTERSRIGAKMLMNAGVEVASGGEAISAIVQRDSFNRFDRIVEDRDMIETYLPLRDDAGNIVGIFEIHSDISEFYVRIAKTQRTIGVGVGAAMISLYVLLVVLFWRSDRQLFRGMVLPAARRGETESESVNRAKTEFVATISHEIRTPLNAVLGMTDLLNLTNLTRKQREYIRTIQSSGDMLISLVDNLLDFAQLTSSKLELRTHEFDVMDLVERVLHIMGHSAYSKGLELIGDMRHDLDLRILADKRRLQQILVNIISNAIKFTDSGEIVVKSDATEMEGDRMLLRFTVTDTGPGIDDNDRERLFAAFASGARPASDQPYGSGLGLTISKQLLDAMGGRIDLASRPHGGTIATIEVPVARVSSSSAEDLAGRREGWPTRVLSLHSNRAAALSICGLLTKWDMECETIFDIDEGLHRLRVAASAGKAFECAIVDSALTPQDGLQVVRRIRRTPELERLPVILLTSISEPLGIGEVSALGHLRCVNKPVLPLELRYNMLRSVQEEQRRIVLDDAQAAEAVEGVAGVRILIAEDNPVSSGVLRAMLQSEGYGADVVEDGPAVLEAMQDGSYDLLLLDCQMPGMDGDRVTQEIAANPDLYGRKPVVVAVTADTTEQHRTQCLAAGMDDFMPKPVRLERLRNGLARWLALIAERSGDEDRQALTDLRKNLVERTGYADESFLSDYIGLFLDDTEKRLAAMSAAFVNGDATSVRREGHALKGSCLELGADRMARYCEDLSYAAKSENLDEIGAVIGKLDREFARLRPVYESAQVSSTSPS